MTKRPVLSFVFLTGWLLLLGLFFAEVEIQIEGSNGWAAGLPTWRIEDNPVVSFFWGGKIMTGYHLWVFSFMALCFHLGYFIHGTFRWFLELRILGSLMVFWIFEDFLWFVLNPAFGIGRFSPENVPWHKYWVAGVLPVDYLIAPLAGFAMIYISYYLESRAESAPLQVRAGQ